MRQLPRYISEFKAGHVFRLICVSLFFLVQTLTLSHAVEFGPDHHDHHHDHQEDEGMPCSIVLIAPEVDAVVPPGLIISGPQAFKAPVAFTPFTSQRYIYNACRAPPGRAPPAFLL